MLIDKIKELNDKFYQACGELKENRGHLGDKDKQVLENLFELYLLDYKLIRLKLSDVDKEISELELQDIKRKADNKIKNETAEEETKQKRGEIVPEMKRRWWQIKKRPNYAMSLVMQAVETETNKYFAQREQELGLTAESDDEIKAVLEGIIPKPRRKRAIKRWEEKIEELAARLSRIQNAGKNGAERATAASKPENAGKPVNSEKPD